MSDEQRCPDCSRPIRLARVYGWSNRSGASKDLIPFDYVKSPEGEYAFPAPDTAKYVEMDERSSIDAPLYTDHRRTCPKRKGDVVDRPRHVLIACDACGDRALLAPEVEDARNGAVKFISDHINCVGRKKAS